MKIIIILILLLSFTIHINGELIEPVDCGSTVVYTTWDEYQCLHYELTQIWWQQERFLIRLRGLIQTQWRE